MRIRSSVFFGALLFGLYLYLLLLNPEGLKVQIYPSKYWETSLGLVVLLAFLAGGLIVGLTDAMKDLKRTLEVKAFKRRQKALWEYLEEAEESLCEGDFEEAEERLKKAVKLLPERPFVYLKLGELYLSTGDWQKAEEALKRARIFEGAETRKLMLEARVALLKGDQQRAEKALLELLRQNPLNREALKALRDLKVKQGLWDEAYEFQERLSKLGFEKEEMLLGLRYERVKALYEKDRKEALKELKSMSKDYPHFVPCWVLWGDLLMKRGKERASLEVWRRGWEETQNPVFLERLEEYFISKGDPRGAIRLYLESMAKRPDDVLLRFLYARLLYRLGLTEEALGRLEEDGELLKGFAPYHYLRARAFAKTGDWQKAFLEFEQGLKLEGRGLFFYRCSNCGQKAPQWSDRCPNCGLWGTFQASLES